MISVDSAPAVPQGQHVDVSKAVHSDEVLRAFIVARFADGFGAAVGFPALLREQAGKASYLVKVDDESHFSIRASVRDPQSKKTWDGSVNIDLTELRYDEIDRESAQRIAALAAGE